MGLSEVLTIIVTSLGGAAVVVWGLTSWLGNVWAKRIADQEKRISDARFKLYVDLWESLQEIRILGDRLWAHASDETLGEFIQSLDKARFAVEKGRIILKDEHYNKLNQIIKTFENYEVGKKRLVDIPVTQRLKELLENPYRGPVDEIINMNHMYKSEYEKLLTEILIDFRGHVGLTG